MPVIRPTGAAIRPRARHDRLCAASPFKVGADLVTTVQPLATLHDQWPDPACEGFGHGQGIESIVGYRVGCRNIWEGARILQGDALDTDAGTYGDLVIEWLAKHGWTDEEARGNVADGRAANSLSEAMNGERRRGRVVEGRFINVYQSQEILSQLVVAALQTPRTYVTLEGGVRNGYFDPPPNTVLGPEYRSGDRNGHCERIAGYDAERDCFILQGSWNSWTWCLLPDGSPAPGCALISPAVLAEAWAIDVVHVS